LEASEDATSDARNGFHGISMAWQDKDVDVSRLAPMPPAFKFFAVLAAIACLALGLAWIVAPAAILALWGVRDPNTDFIVEHRFGALFIGVGAILLMARNAAPSPTRSAISYGVVIGCLVLFFLNLRDLVGQRVGGGILPGMALQLLMIFGFAFSEWRIRRVQKTLKNQVKMNNSVELAKRVLAENEMVPYGIFGVVGVSGVFPPMDFLNEFLALGRDPCDQDGRQKACTPFALSDQDYDEVKAWWSAGHVGAIEDALGVDCWDDWVQEILGR
jgi:hypothetical protein